MKRKLVAISFVLILGVLIISGCRGLTTNLTDDWNLYKNEKNGYSFMYPADCHFGPMPSDYKG